MCALACAGPLGEMLGAIDTVEGEIAAEPRGAGGFGYDPIFFLPERGATMAELGPDEKNRISHRVKAFRRLLDALRGAPGLEGG